MAMKPFRVCPSYLSSHWSVFALSTKLLVVYLNPNQFMHILLANEGAVVSVGLGRVRQWMDKVIVRGWPTKANGISVHYSFGYYLSPVAYTLLSSLTLLGYNTVHPTLASTARVYSSRWSSCCGATSSATGGALNHAKGTHPKHHS